MLTRRLRAVEGKTLLHLAAESGCNLAVVQRVASEFPESAEHQDVNGRFAVQLSTGIAQPWAAALFLDGQFLSLFEEKSQLSKFKKR